MMQKNDAPRKGQNKKDQEEDQVVAEDKVLAEDKEEDQHLPEVEEVVSK